MPGRTPIPGCDTGPVGSSGELANTGVMRGGGELGESRSRSLRNTRVYVP